MTTPDHTNNPISHPPQLGVEILGVGKCVPNRTLTNTDLTSVMDTSDEWIVQRTGITQRRVHDPESEGTADLASGAALHALERAGIDASEIDLCIAATMTPDMPTPSVANVTTHRIGAGNIGSFDINAACSGFVVALNTAYELMRSGAYSKVLLIGCDCITRHLDYSTYGRGAAILFGDAAGAFVLSSTTDTQQGLIASAMHSDAGRARHLFVPMRERDFPEGTDKDPRKINAVQMNGQAVFKFAVSTFPKLIADTLDKAGLNPDDVDHYVCHQSNARILAAARDRFGLRDEQLHVNIHHLGNTVGASVPLVYNDLWEAGRIKQGQRVMFLGFGAGLTWGSSLWQC